MGTDWDAITNALVMRDGGCMAPMLGAADACRDSTGHWPTLHTLERDHVRGNPPVGILAKLREGGHGKRPPNDLGHLMLLCWWHHQGGNPPWALTHRNLQRAYIANTQRGMSRYEAALAAVAEWGA